MATTITFPEGSTGQDAYTTNESNTLMLPITPDSSNAFTTSNFDLYLSYSAPDSIVTWPALVSALGSDFSSLRAGIGMTPSAFSATASGADLVPLNPMKETITLKKGTTLFLPVQKSLPPSVNLLQLRSRLNAAAVQQRPASQTSISTTASVAPSAGNSPTAITFPTATSVTSTYAYTGNFGGPPSPIVPIANATTREASDFFLYIPFSATTATNVIYSTLLAALATDCNRPAFAINPSVFIIDSPGAAPTAIDYAKVTVSLDNGTLLLPVTKNLPASITLQNLMNAVTNAANRDGSTGSDQVSKSVLAGAVAGGTIGAFLLGVLFCGSIFFCFKRRSRNRGATKARSDGTSLDRPVDKLLGESVPMGLMGWRKHLPQEKDDGALFKTFNSIFEQARIHMEGFYKSKPQNLWGESIEKLTELSGDSFPRALLQVDDQVLMLHGILVRWMVHRISGRCGVEESLLPQEFAEFAKRSNWDMERDAEHNGGSVSNKPGFPQAFAQWRQLTGFLTPDFTNNRAFQAELNVKLDSGVRTLEAAFAPWETAGKSIDDRKRSLRRILQDLSEAGTLLFTQPSVFTFEWSAQGRDRVNVTPAVVRRSDDSTASTDGRVLVKATQTKLAE